MLIDIDNVLSNDESFIKSIIKFSCGTTPTYRIIGDEVKYYYYIVESIH